MNQGNERTTSMSKTKGLVQMAIFAALIVVLAFTPFIGYIPLGFTRATIIHIPVIMGSLMLGPKKGAALGGVFGLTSFINNTINPTLTSFVFTPFYSLGEYSGGIGSLINLFCATYFDRCSAVLCLPSDQEAFKEQWSIFYWTGCGRTFRSTDQYASCYESYFCIFQK